MYPWATIRLPITLNHLIRLSWEGPGDQLPAHKSQIFKYFKVPTDDVTPLNKNALIDELVRQCGNFEVIPHDGVDFIRKIDVWSMTKIREWQKIFDALNMEYEPLHNYDRTEEEEIKVDNVKMEESGALSKIAGVDSGSLVEDSSAKGDNKHTDDDHSDRKLRSYGNIGVTTSQQMLESEIELRRQYNMYQIIIDDFKQEFCLLVY